MSARLAGWISIVGIAAYFANSAIGKYWIMTGQGISPPIDGVPEFFLLAGSVIFMAIWLSKSKSIRNQNS
jgi:hypothetical protein